MSRCLQAQTSRNRLIVQGDVPIRECDQRIGRTQRSADRKRLNFGRHFPFQKSSAVYRDRQPCWPRTGPDACAVPEFRSRQLRPFAYSSPLPGWKSRGLYGAVGEPPKPRRISVQRFPVDVALSEKLSTQMFVFEWPASFRLAISADSLRPTRTSKRSSHRLIWTAVEIAQSPPSVGRVDGGTKSPYAITDVFLAFVRPRTRRGSSHPPSVRFVSYSSLSDSLSPLSISLCLPKQ